MARIRTIKPEFFKHEGLFDLEDATSLPIRLSFAGLWLIADREGRFKWRPRTIKADVLPFDNVNFEDVLDALVGAGFLIKYEVDGEYYGCIPRFSEHQRVNQREAASTLPEPDNASTCTHVQAHGEGKGREGNKEGKGRSVTSAKADDAGTAYALWNDLADELDLAKARKTKGPSLDNLKRRLKEHGIEGWSNALNGIRGSPHHQGTNATGWRIDMPWLVSHPKQFESLMMKGETYGERGGPSAREPHNRQLETSRESLAEAFGEDLRPE